MSAGYVHCAQCGVERSLVLEMAVERVAEIVRGFSADHAHGLVMIQTPGPAREARAAKRARWADAPRTIPCAWCSKPATQRDEAKDPICAGCAGRAA